MRFKPTPEVLWPNEKLGSNCSTPAPHHVHSVWNTEHVHTRDCLNGWGSGGGLWNSAWWEQPPGHGDLTLGLWLVGLTAGRPPSPQSLVTPHSPCSHEGEMPSVKIQRCRGWQNRCKNLRPAPSRAPDSKEQSKMEWQMRFGESALFLFLSVHLTKRTSNGVGSSSLYKLPSFLAYCSA